MTTTPTRADAVAHVYELVLSNECEQASHAAQAIRELDEAELIHRDT